MALRQPITPRLADPDAERARRVHEDCIRELQGLTCTNLRVIPNVTLASGVATPVAHGLGRPALWAQPSAPRGASSSGRIEEIRDGHDRAKYVVLKATGWGATVTVDVAVL